MAKLIEGSAVVKGKKFGIIASRFNDFITKQLVAGCSDTLIRHGAKDDDLTIAWVPGAFEIPAVAGRMAGSKKYDAVICLGTIIRGATPHFDFVASEAAKGIARAGQDAGIPVIFGIITADTIEQAIERAGTKDGNKGRDAAVSAIEMVNVFEQLK
ncbi:MAG: 6,7-dimethyl-8-ribityllumazine synthase [Candidatus Omnitrophica bacterium]|nr:6,7-dimethyl-8-ribityllumazine synthase [Candidatus Omnitrophota bacterium]MDD4940298.1 6,7-dimethyl-8-ribityllumazine synthase [Candidatus Omnitrophota bacterium]MDD5775212.1 6,7-dimethyl-8-ribityllumazine synthase [Candidatus Omnitrophota bacterium]HNQ51406.1 6,7-dimethyl-8-ribityllumazine synthase [Candidatus Omnitrophota bacterium]HQO38268.1 6,7-dimethyl-8-ribityllumazine synthase [Candidatus Omnitrophota bacterium]